MIRRLLTAATMEVTIAGGTVTATASPAQWPVPNAPIIFAQSCSAMDYENSDGDCITLGRLNPIARRKGPVPSAMTARMRSALIVPVHAPATAAYPNG
jgi:hypothetical protein